MMRFEKISMQRVQGLMWRRFISTH